MKTSPFFILMFILFALLTVSPRLADDSNSESEEEETELIVA